MALDTYSALQTAIGNWLNRADLSATIPDFITLAESAMLKKLLKAKSEGKMLPRDMLASATVQFVAGTEFYAFPNASTFLGPLTFTIEPQTISGQTYGAVQLDYLDPANLDYLKQKRGTSPTSMIPGVYTVRDKNTGSNAIQVVPIPDLAYVGTMFYWQSPFPLSGGVNWILQKHPDAYLYGALAASAPFLMDDQRITVWNALFQTALEDILLADPLPNDRSWLRMDSGLMHPRRSGFNILTGDYVTQP